MWIKILLFHAGFLAGKCIYIYTGAIFFRSICPGKKLSCMAKQKGGLKLRGTINNMTFYKWRDEYYVRSKSSLTGKRVKTDSHFRTTMVNASLLAEASKIASVGYRLIKDEKKK